MKKNWKLLILSSLLGLTIVSQLRASIPNIKVAYQLKPAQKWIEDEEEKPSKAIYQYNLSEDNSIAMSFSFLETSLKSEVTKKSVKDITAELYHGKNLVFSMLGNKPFNITSSNLVTKDNLQFLIVQSNYQVVKETFFLVEKYYIFNDQTLLASLRWSSKSDPEKIKLALQDFENTEIKNEQVGP